MSENKKLKLSAKAKVKPVAGEPLKVEFAPGCFDHIDVDSQEELDAIMSEITDMFANMTPEELRANSRQLTDEDFESMDPEERAILEQAFKDHDTEIRKNRLQ
jgi:hypothetical protein